MSRLISLLERISFLKNQVLMGKKTLLDEDLESLFIEFKDLISESELETSIQIMDNGTIILEQKLEELRNFISNISQKDQILEYLRNSSSDESFSQILNKTWQSPLLLPNFSLSFLTKSFERLVLNKKSTNLEMFFKEKPILGVPDIKELPEIDKPYKIKMLGYLNLIRPLLPATLEELIDRNHSIDVYYENFSYILHLLQLGFLSFTKKTQHFDITNKKIEGKFDE
ncbi:hypothetical protein DSAG12_00498 [Promethearchaeum syntrophicum]|uniref:Uncharacterized protein n=1 Tax=Promethearchaeum syntrophicum TaxID=2594042 RepID=A0A5B9D6Q0_9ARCH|nr:hypothetical protein [Candidatus Prometheoarchaeum syntrophicum]QEE14685.1 hypothetical protein DSAG12_00498 [Candidatus Prometheoarchaeum syntrophicum]